MERIEKLGKAAVSCPIFGMQVLVSVVGMGVSVTQLLRGMDPAVYLPITTSIIGYWLPAPKRPPAPLAELAEESMASVTGPPRSPPPHTPPRTPPRTPPPTSSPGEKTCVERSR